MIKSEKNTKRKRIFVLCLALTAFLAMPLTVGAWQATTGEMGGYGLRGSVNIYDTHAHAITECEYAAAYVTVDVSYYSVDHENNIVHMEQKHGSGYGYTNAVARKADENANDRSDRAVSTHHACFGAYQWNPASVTIYY